MLDLTNYSYLKLCSYIKGFCERSYCSHDTGYYRTKTIDLYWNQWYCFTVQK